MRRDAALPWSSRCLGHPWSTATRGLLIKGRRRRVVTSPHPFGLQLRAQLLASPNHFGSWLSRSCWSEPTHATWPSGRSSTAGTSSSSLTWGSTSIRDTRGKGTVKYCPVYVNNRGWLEAAMSCTDWTNLNILLLEFSKKCSAKFWRTHL